MHMYHFHRYTHTALSAAYGTVYTCPMGSLQRRYMYLVVCDAVLVIIIIIIINEQNGVFQLEDHNFCCKKHTKMKFSPSIKAW